MRNDLLNKRLIKNYISQNTFFCILLLIKIDIDIIKIQDET